MNVFDRATADGAIAGRRKLAGLPYTPTPFGLWDAAVVRRRIAARWWSAFTAAAALPPIPSEAEMDAIDAADPG